MVQELVGARVARLSRPVRRLLLAVAMNSDLGVRQLEAIGGQEEVEEAVESGVLFIDSNRIRASHPLLAAAARAQATAGERRRLHLELAAAVSDEESRARHLALGTSRPDGALAALVEAASARAAARGAAGDAVDLAAQALRLTPPGSVELGDRVLTLADLLLIAGEPDRAAELLSARMDDLPRPSARARAHLLLSYGPANMSTVEEHLEHALELSEEDMGLRATVLARKARISATVQLERLEEAHAWASEALPAARGAGPDVERRVLCALAWNRILLGRPIDDLQRRLPALPDRMSLWEGSLERLAAIRLEFRGEVEKARPIFGELLALADARGEAASSVALKADLCMLELRAGDMKAAARFLLEVDEDPLNAASVRVGGALGMALLAAGRGHHQDVARWATAATGDLNTGQNFSRLWALRADGLAAIAAHEPERATASLASVWEHMEREGVDEPGTLPVASDLVEALVDLGRFGEARAVGERLRRLAEAQQHPWGLATVKRCDALVALAASRDEGALRQLAESADAYRELGLRFDHARTLLVAGRAARRLKKWGVARGLLEQAAAAFDGSGSPGWADDARAELARVGARRPAPEGELTPSERRVTELAAEGLSNKDIAHALAVSVHTVEIHLAHAFAKLGVQSRSQLAGRLHRSN
jgi:DNA-binding CsgD family transcriptional regulator